MESDANLAFYERQKLKTVVKIPGSKVSDLQRPENAKRVERLQIPP